MSCRDSQRNARLHTASPVCAAALLCLLASAPLAHAQAQQSADAERTLPTVNVSVEERSSQGSMRPGALRDEIVKTESISARTIERSGASNLNESVDKKPGIAVQVECSICNVRNVLLNNLPGRYTTLLIDGIPMYSSVSSAYGLDSVSVHGVERIDVARGAGASLIAPEALAGTVNVVTKRPLRNEAHLRTQLGNMGSRQADAYLARPLDGGALSATLNYNRHDAWDGNGDGISEYTGYDRRLAGLGFFADDAGGFKLRGRLDLVNEKRGGGALETYRRPGSVQADASGNPFDFSAGAGGSPIAHGWVNPADGSLVDYDLGRLGYSEYIHTRREQFVLSGTRPLGAGALRLALGTARHRQESFYEFSDYQARQAQHYAEASYQLPVNGWLLTGGLNYRYENLRSHGITEAREHVDGVDNYRYEVPALFVQAYSTFLDDRLELNGSLRYDRHNVYGGIVSPRLNALYQHTGHVSSRFSVGKGFRAPTSFFEQDHGILDTIRIERQLDKPEVSHNLSYALNYADERLAVTGSYHYNRIKNFALLDPSHTDAAGNPVTLFTSSPGKVVVQGADVNLSYLLTPALTVSAAAEVFNYRFPAGTLVFARPKSRAFLSLDYERGPWEAMARVNFTGPMDLNRFHDDGSGNQNRYNFDGTPKLKKSPSFATFDARVQYNLHRNVSLFVGVDNLFDYYQSKKESPLWVDAEGGYDVTHIWGPMRGRYVYAGAKFSF
ncbi:TonB-dependent receptor [Vandammella animalimorsus]|uniref:TonB-dependent receptor n=1 Tax=Vandammella animalimorsus TaxID=2029117 RepID=A0A2A2AY88_9BURK|nr:TonB-dependent receptor [Vandammella animalimorsus]PAT42743.1 TonB-dependent receptor [Vandammella animalimorsus]